jgi:hypothetical protein
MRSLFAVSIVCLVACFGAGCADAPEETTQEAEPTAESMTAHGSVNGMPDDDVHSQAMGQMMGSPDHNMGINRTVNLSDDIRSAWKGVKIRLVDTTENDEQLFDIDLGTTAELGDSGLSIAVSTFIPSFVMDQGGITSRGSEPDNPAVRAVITEEGSEPFEGWLFAGMPDIHPFPHERYAVFLVEGVPAD